MFRMPQHVITRYTADELVHARKTAGKTRSIARREHPLVIDVRRAGSTTVDLKLSFQSFTRETGISGVPTGFRPNASLFWHGVRIRGIDWTIAHDVLWKGMPTGERIRGWHEHFWTDEDSSASIRSPQPSPSRNASVSQLITWACNQWNIEGVATSQELFNE